MVKDRKDPFFSIVIPVYKAEQILDKLVDEIIKVMKEINQSYEIIMVDDRSPDNCWEVLKTLSCKFNQVKGVRLSKNFGQHPAIMAGLTLSSGEWIVVMDCDLQDQPKEIIKLYNKTKEGFEIVMAKRNNRQDSYLKKATSRLFSLVYSYLTETKFDGTIANFGIYNKKVILEILKMNDYIKSFPLFVSWVGYNFGSVEVEHANRISGKSSYTIPKLLSLAFNSIISFSNKPLKLFVKFGMIISLISFVLGLRTLFKYYLGEISVLGYSSLMVSIWFLSGIIITIIGVTGIYIGKIFDQSKGRKSFIIDKITNHDIQ